MSKKILQQQVYSAFTAVLLSLLPLVASSSQTQVKPTLVETQSTPQQYQSHRFDNNTLTVTTSLGKLTFNAFSQDSFEVVFNAHTDNVPAADLPSFSLKPGLTKQAVKLSSRSNQLILRNNQLSAEITKQPLSVKYFYQGRLLTEQKDFFQANSITPELSRAVHGVRFKLSDNEKILGGGERVLGMDRRGHRIPLYNRAHYGYETHSKQMNYSLPAVLSSNKYMILFDNSAKGWLDIGYTNPSNLQFEAVAGRNAYIIIGAETYAELTSHYVELTGTQPMPARWTLGNFASRFGYHDQAEVLQTAELFKQQEIPLDAIILDLYWFGKGIKGHMGNLDWDKTAFPTPEKMINKLDQQGVKTVMITEPFVLSTSKKWQDAIDSNALATSSNGEPKTFDFYFGNTGLIDVFNSNGRDWFAKVYHDLYQQGVRGWWGDLGEPEVHPSDALHRLDNNTIVGADSIHNVYGHRWAQLVFEQQQALAANTRPFILMRSGFAGSQRYGILPWTGDVSRSWGGLKPQVELSLQMGLFGLAYTHSDLGGFGGGDKFDPELYIRWLQYGVFQPIYRPHGQEHIPSEVVFHNQQTRDIVKKFIELRYQLLPYHYTMAYQNATQGTPLMRPMFFDNDLDNNASNRAFDNSTSYLWGDSFFVQPITEPMADIAANGELANNNTSVKVNLPSGVWFNFFDDKKYLGGRTHELAVNIETLPVFVKAGAFVPRIETIQTTDNYQRNQLDLHYYADAAVSQSSGQIYEDDGVSLDAISKNNFELLTFNAKHKNAALEISLKRDGGSYPQMPKERALNLMIHNWCQKPKAVLFNNQKVSQYQWQQASCLLTVPVNWQHQASRLVVR